MSRRNRSPIEGPFNQPLLSDSRKPCPIDGADILETKMNIDGILELQVLYQGTMYYGSGLEVTLRPDGPITEILDEENKI
jgi:hypothetical protein